LKVIKRIMYGRNNFNLLRNKLLRLENRRIFN
jgi:transposase